MIVLRPLVATDAPQLATIHKDAFGMHCWNETMFADSLHSPDVWGMLLENSGHPAGFALCQYVSDDCEILTFAILPRLQRRGLGRHLLQTVYDAAKARPGSRIFLEVAADNLAARQLYANFGFQPTGTRPNYYPRPDGAVDAVLMQFNIRAS
ncbi:MAG: ribosomal protein S18-alanine N-acetyltransferase [Alphaproteobacteria bacterium]